MSVDYAEGLKIAGGGLGVTFLVLSSLAVVTWLVGFIVQKASARREKAVPAETGQTSDTAKTSKESAARG